MKRASGRWESPSGWQGACQRPQPWRFARQSEPAGCTSTCSRTPGGTTPSPLRSPPRPRRHGVHPPALDRTEGRSGPQPVHPPNGPCQSCPAETGPDGLAPDRHVTGFPSRHAAWKDGGPRVVPRVLLVHCRFCSRVTACARCAVRAAGRRPGWSRSICRPGCDIPGCRSWDTAPWCRSGPSGTPLG